MDLITSNEILSTKHVDCDDCNHQKLLFFDHTKHSQNPSKPGQWHWRAWMDTIVGFFSIWRGMSSHNHTSRTSQVLMSKSGCCLRFWSMAVSDQKLGGAWTSTRILSMAQLAFSWFLCSDFHRFQNHSKPFLQLAQSKSIGHNLTLSEALSWILLEMTFVIRQLTDGGKLWSISYISPRISSVENRLE